jgi:hypothetical protein
LSKISSKPGAFVLMAAAEEVCKYVIKNMLDRSSQETQKLLEKLEHERALACMEIRRLQEQLGLAGS